MGGYQKVTIIGTVSRTPEMSYTSSGMGILTINIVTSYKKKDSQEEVASFHRVKAFGKQAETVAKYFDKGKGIHVECELSYGQYEKDGVKHYTTDLIMQKFSFLPGKSDSNQQNNQGGYQQQPQAQGGYQNQQNQGQGFHNPPQGQGGYQQQPPQQQEQFGNGMNQQGGGHPDVPDDNIPF